MRLYTLPEGLQGTPESFIRSHLHLCSDPGVGLVSPIDVSGQLYVSVDHRVPQSTADYWLGNGDFWTAPSENALHLVRFGDKDCPVSFRAKGIDWFPSCSWLEEPSRSDVSDYFNLAFTVVSDFNAFASQFGDDIYIPTVLYRPISTQRLMVPDWEIGVHADSSTPVEAFDSWLDMFKSMSGYYSE